MPGARAVLARNRSKTSYPRKRPGTKRVSTQEAVQVRLGSGAGGNQDYTGGSLERGVRAATHDSHKR